MIRQTPDGVTLTVRVLPRAAKPGIAGTRAGAVLVRLASAPVDGAANAELVALLATALDVPRRAVAIVSGDRSRTKTLRILGRTAGDIQRLLR